MTAYYNENDRFAAEWLRELIKAGHIAPGDVDDRSIEDVRPDDLAGYTQCHFFAGIGTWSFALRNAGWPDDRPVWTGSPPCQPFSLAGRGGGYDDARHLAPKWLDLIKECRPPEVFGEQVASAFANKKHHWIDDLQDALEAEGYATGKIVLPACSIGAPHIRQRGWFVAERVGHTSEPRLEGHTGHGNDKHEQGRDNAQPGGPVTETGGDGWLEHPEHQYQRSARQQQERAGNTIRAGEIGGMADTKREQKHKEQQRPEEAEREWGADQLGGCCMAGSGPGPTHSRWQSADWLLCRDGKWRPVEPGTFPLVDGAPARVGRLRGYGNGIQAEVVEEFIRAYLG